MPKHYEFELGKSANDLVNNIFQLKEDETFVITADSASDEDVVNATARAAFAAGAKPMVIWNAYPCGVAEAADPMLPLEPLTAALNNCDAWIEFNEAWLLYSTPFKRATKQNKKLRYLCAVGMNKDMMVRVIGRVDLDLLKEFMTKLVNMTKEADHMRITTPAGTDVEFDNHPGRPVTKDSGDASEPGRIAMLPGQIGWSPKFESINGKIVFDGSLSPPVGKLETPVELTVENGDIKDIEGGTEAREFERWLKSFKDKEHYDQMWRMAHVCYGVNPGAKNTGDIVEDERVWGATEWGMGNVGGIFTGGKPIPGPGHTDGICLNSSVWIDGEQILERGSFVHPDLKKYEEELL